jgi:phosphoglycerate dehydrogenase-like enzyme
MPTTSWSMRTLPTAPSRRSFWRAKKLRWIAAPGAGLGPDWYYKELIESPVVVTNTRGIFNEHLAAHTMAFILAFARRFDHYLPFQAQHVWNPGEKMIGLDDKTALIVGVGGSGAEISRLCAAFGMRTLGVDPRETNPPVGMETLATPDRLDAMLGSADFVILTVPESPETIDMFDAHRFGLMKAGSYFINVGRGACVVTDDLVAALQSGHLAGAGLDVVAPEPLPKDHPLWAMPGVLITPHIAVYGAPNQERREALLLENCRRFAEGEPLLNVVDKRLWF